MTSKHILRGSCQQGWRKKQSLAQEELAYTTEKLQDLENLNQKDHEHMYVLFFFNLSTPMHSLEI